VLTWNTWGKRFSPTVLSMEPETTRTSPFASTVTGRAGLQRILAILKNPVYAGAFAYGRISTRSRIIEGPSGKTAGNGVPMEPWVGTISFWYSTG
jgi:hypothetical protein